MTSYSEWLKDHKFLQVGAAVGIAAGIGLAASRALDHLEPVARGKLAMYATMSTGGSLPVTQFADAEAEVKVRWEAGVMDYVLVLNDQSGAMAKWVSEHPHGDFYIDWLNANETSFRRITIPFSSFGNSEAVLKADGHVSCNQEQYARVYDRSAYWSLSWDTHDSK